MESADVNIRAVWFEDCTVDELTTEHPDFAAAGDKLEEIERLR